MAELARLLDSQTGVHLYETLAQPNDLLSCGASVLLMDSEKQTFYIKSADAAGMPSMRTFDYTERNASVKPSSSAQDAPEYVTRDELNTLTKRLEALEGRKKKGVTQDEPTV